MIWGSNPGRGKRYLFTPKTSRLALGYIQLPIQLVTELSSVVNRPGRDADHLVQRLRMSEVVNLRKRNV